MSVIVPTHQRAAMLAHCLESLSRQTVLPREIIVVDDGSTDDTASVAARFAPLVRYIRTDSKSGKSVAVNLALPQVQGDFVWVFDDDDMALPTAIAQLQAPLIADATLGFSFGYFTEGVTAEDQSVVSRGYESSVPDLATRGMLAPLLEHNYLGGARMMFRTRALRDVGGFDPFYLRSQDYEIAIRMVRYYRGQAVLDAPLYLYRVHWRPRKKNDTKSKGANPDKSWFEYDQHMIARLFESMPLEQLLAPLPARPVSERELLLQRAGIYAAKLMFPEMLADFRRIAEQGDESPHTPEEQSQIESIFFTTPMYGMGDLLDDSPTVAQLKELSSQSSAVRRIIRHATSAALSRSAAVILQKRMPRRSWRILRTALVFGLFGRSA